MKKIIYKAAERGHANHGWLDSYHSFSFGHYYDPAKLQFGALRVLNDDTVKAGHGFGKHPHANMEIVSIPLHGDLKHEDSTGRKEIIRQYDVQIMSAGTGIAHSEMNASDTDEVKFLQVWVLPKQIDIEPRYDQKTFRPEDRINKLQTVVAPGNPEAIHINQDAWFSLGNLEQGFTIDYHLNLPTNGVYVFVLEGEVTVNDTTLGRRDAVGIWETGKLQLKAGTAAEVLLIEVPMLKDES